MLRRLLPIKHRSASSIGKIGCPQCSEGKDHANKRIVKKNLGRSDLDKTKRCSREGKEERKVALLFVPSGI
jgi:hypothetical protein